MKFIIYIKNTIILHITSFLLAFAAIYGSSMMLLMNERAVSLLLSLWQDVNIVAVLDSSVQDPELEKIINRIQQQSSVEQVTLIRPDEGWQLLQDEEDLELALQVSSENALPNVLIISPHIAQADKFPALINMVRNLDGIEKIKYDDKRINKLGIFTDHFKFVRKGLLVIIGVLCFSLILFIIRFLLIVSFKKYIGIIIIQNVCGLMGAFFGNIIMCKHIKNLDILDILVSAFSLNVLITGIAVGCGVGLFAVAAHQLFIKKLPMRYQRNT